jgi:hypothetical protein
MAMPMISGLYSWQKITRSLGDTWRRNCSAAFFLRGAVVNAREEFLSEAISTTMVECVVDDFWDLEG